MSSHAKEYAAQYRVNHREEIRENHLRWRRKNKTVHNERGAQWKVKNPDKVREGGRRYYEQNKNIILSKAKVARAMMTEKQREKRREQAKVNKRNHLLRNPEQVRAMRRAERERYKLNSPEKNKIRKHVGQSVRYKRTRATHDGTVTTQVLRELLLNTHSCSYCHISLEGREKHIDHMNPLVLGGRHTILNLTICCAECNVRKGRLPYDVWMAKIGAKWCQ